MDTRIRSEENPKKAPVVIFGAGYVGLALAQAALARGHDVVALTRNFEKAMLLDEAGARVLVGDLESDSWHSRVTPAGAHVVNCVASGGGGVEGYRKSYYNGTRSVLRWLDGGPPPASFVYTSSTSVYPQGGRQRITESSPAEPVADTAQVLRETERLIEAFSFRAPWAILRLAGLYGPDRHSLLDQLRAGATVLPGRGDFHLNLLHRDDVVSAILAFWSHGTSSSSGIYNVADSEAPEKAALVAWLAQRLGRAVPAFTGEADSRRRGLVPDRLICSEKLRSALAWAPRYPTFRDGYEAILGA